MPAGNEHANWNGRKSRSVWGNSTNKNCYWKNKKNEKNISDGSVLDSSESSEGFAEKGDGSNGESSGEKVVNKEITLKRSRVSIQSIPRSLDSIVEKKKGQKKEKSNKKSSHFSIPSP